MAVYCWTGNCWVKKVPIRLVMSPVSQVKRKATERASVSFFSNSYRFVELAQISNTKY